MSQKRALTVKELSVEYPVPERTIKAVKQIDLDIYQGELLGLIGESGSGKTTAAMAILQLLEKPGRVTGGQVYLRDEIELLRLPEKEFRKLRWQELALVSQGAMNSLNPTMRIKDQIADAIKAHEGKQSKKELKERILSLLSRVGLPNRVYGVYPHELSGGMKQRVGIAMAISLNPTLIIADEPTSALDVVSQRIVAQTLLDIKETMGISILLIGHDIALMAQLTDRVAVMFDGFIVEVGATKDVFGSPIHPYTQMLINAVPTITERKPFKAIDEEAMHEFAKNMTIPLPLNEVAPGHWVADFA